MMQLLQLYTQTHMYQHVVAIDDTDNDGADNDVDVKHNDDD